MSTLLYNPRPTLRPTRAFDTLLNEVLRDTQPTTPTPSTSFVPAADILETAQGFELHLALPGVAKDAVSIDFQDGQLVVTGRRPAPATEGDAAPTLRRVETRFGEFPPRFSPARNGEREKYQRRNGRWPAAHHAAFRHGKGNQAAHRSALKFA